MEDTNLFIKSLNAKYCKIIIEILLTLLKNLLARILKSLGENLGRFLQNFENLARFLQQLERLFKSLAPHCTGHNMYNILEKSCKICARFLQEISQKSRKNLGKNLARFCKSCNNFKVLQDLARLCNSCKNLARILARFLSRVNLIY
jgi:hypothetical protein